MKDNCIKKSCLWDALLPIRSCLLTAFFVVAWDSSSLLLVTPVQLMWSSGWNTSALVTKWYAYVHVWSIVHVVMCVCVCTCVCVCVLIAAWRDGAFKECPPTFEEGQLPDFILCMRSIPAQLMRPGIGRNVSCIVGGFSKHLGLLCKEDVVHW